MPIFSAVVTMKTTMVVVADDPVHAEEVARADARQGFRDASAEPQVVSIGEVYTLAQLRDGWTGECVPYGGCGNIRLRELLPTAA